MRIFLIVFLLSSVTYALTDSEIQQLKSYGSVFTEHACSDGKIKDCFDVDDLTCRNTVLASYNSCYALKMDQLKTIKSSDFEKIKTQLSECTDKDVTNKLIAKLRANKACKLSGGKK